MARFMLVAMVAVVVRFVTVFARSTRATDHIGVLQSGYKRPALSATQRAKMDAAVAKGQDTLERIRTTYPVLRHDYTVDPALVAKVATMKLKQLEKICGAKLGNPSKMPGYSFGTPAAECLVGGHLRGKHGTSCEFCYAFETGFYAFAAIVAAAYRRLHAFELWLRGNNELFPYALARLIAHYSATYKHQDGSIGTDVFRFHDAGDLQSVEMLRGICMVAELCPAIRFWLPTREWKLLRAFHNAGYRYPANLQVNFSMHYRNAPLKDLARCTSMGIGVSVVSDDGDTTRYEAMGAHICPSLMQQGKCLDCRACWGVRPSERSTARQQPIIVYRFH
jgi:hypothetical protein